MQQNSYSNNRPNNQRNSSRDQGGENQSTLKPDQPVNFFKDKINNIYDESVFSDKAEKQAGEMNDSKLPLTSTQLRRFFGEMKGLYQRWKNQQKSPEEFNRILPLIKLLKSKVYYAYGRKKIPKKFSEFLIGGIDQIKDSNDFEAFVLYFEAVVGFLYGKELVTK